MSPVTIIHYIGMPLHRVLQHSLYDERYLYSIGQVILTNCWERLIYFTFLKSFDHFKRLCSATEFIALQCNEFICIPGFSPSSSGIFFHKKKPMQSNALEALNNPILLQMKIYIYIVRT